MFLSLQGPGLNGRIGWIPHEIVIRLEIGSLFSDRAYMEDSVDFWHEPGMRLKCRSLINDRAYLEDLEDFSMNHSLD
jgi:hypothetical protein